MTVRPLEREFRLAAFLTGSMALHLLLLWAAIGLLPQPGDMQLSLPRDIELGMLDTLDDRAPGGSGASPEAAPPAPAPPQMTPALRPRAPQPRAKAIASADFVLDAGVLDAAAATAGDGAVADAGAELAAFGYDAGDDGLLAAQRSGDGQAPLGAGAGLGFGAGGFGDGLGGARGGRGAIIGLHLDMDRIRDSSLILEVSSMLELIPEWLRVLDGSGLDAQRDFTRIFVATPSLTRSGLVLSARVIGGEAKVARAVAQLAAERAQPATFALEHGMRIAPWRSRGPTERVVGLPGGDQLVIARRPDVSRLLSVSAAVAARHGKEPGIEKLKGPLALLAMYEGEAVALSVEGLRSYLEQDLAYAPFGLRLSLRHLDEHYAELRAYGYYPSAASAQAAMPALEALRASWLEHPRISYLGLRSALHDAELSQDGRTASLRVRLTLHQVRYLLAYVTRALALRE